MAVDRPVWLTERSARSLCGECIITVQTAAVETLVDVGVVANSDRQFLLSQIARSSSWNDCADLPALVQAASERTPIGLVVANAEFDSGEKPRLHPPATRGRERYPRQAREENLAHPRSACRDAAGVFATAQQLPSAPSFAQFTGRLVGP
jgi:hypothetical protein